jgi:hypothetical protein
MMWLNIGAELMSEEFKGTCGMVKVYDLTYYFSNVKRSITVVT